MVFTYVAKFPHVLNYAPLRIWHVTDEKKPRFHFITNAAGQYLVPILIFVLALEHPRWLFIGGKCEEMAQLAPKMYCLLSQVY